MRAAAVFVGITLIAASAQAQTPTPAAHRGDAIRFSRQAVAPIPGLDALTIIATAGDTVVVRKGLISVNAKPVDGLSREFLESLPEKGLSQKVLPGYALVIADSRGRGGPIRYWALARLDALVGRGVQIVAGR
jgi:hypothetical protein